IGGVRMARCPMSCFCRANRAAPDGTTYGGDQVKRCEFITLLGGAAAVYPLTVRAQQPARMSRIGWIAIGTPQGSEFLDAVREGLRQLDYVEGRSIIIEQR